MSKAKVKAPLLFIDTVHKGCNVCEQHIFKTPEATPDDVTESDYVHHYDSRKASDFYKWPEESEDEK